MSVINSDSMRAGAAGAGGAGYVISNSMRFNGDDTAYTTITPAGAGNLKTWTFSSWVKRGKLDSVGNTRSLFSCGTTGANRATIGWSADSFDVSSNNGSWYAQISTAKYRDPAAWYNFVVAFDTTNGTGGDRVRQWCNGVETTSFSTDGNPVLNSDHPFNSAVQHDIGLYSPSRGATDHSDSLLADVNMIDGLALDATSFGEFDVSGNWVPINTAGLTFGTNGFRLEFKVAPGTGNGAGTDTSGEANHFTDSGLAANDQMKDSPTDDVDNDVGNYAVMLPTCGTGGGSAVFADGNLDVSVTGHFTAISSIPIDVNDTDGFYMEVTLRSGGSADYHVVGIGETSGSPWAINAYPSTRFSNVCYIYAYNGEILIDDGSLGTTAAISMGDVVQIAVKGGELYIGVNDTYYANDKGTDGNPSAGTNPTSASNLNAANGEYVLICGRNDASGTDDFVVNFGQTAFAHTPPTGYKKLHTANLPAPAIKDPSKYFQVDTFTGTGSELVRTLTDAAGDAVKPDLVWIKDRDTVVEHVLTDSARGATKELSIDAGIEETVAQGLKSFDTSGYTLGTDASYNASSSLNVAWCWVAASGSGSSNTDGTINTTTTTANTTSLFSASVFEGTGANATIGHGLAVTPEFVVIKNYDSTSGEWRVYHVGNTSAPETDYIKLSATSATADDASVWNDTAPTSSVVALGSNGDINESGKTHLMLCWAGVEGYSKFGSYVGNGSTDGTFVYCGFRPKWIIRKSSSAVDNWAGIDAGRDLYNVSDTFVRMNDATAEGTGGEIDILSNGFKLRTTGVNANAATYIFAAFAEFPFGGDGVSQARAR